MENYNQYMMDDEHCHDLQHSRFQLGEGALRDLQKDISSKRKRTEQMLAELGFSTVKRDAGYYEREVNLRAEYNARQEEYDAFFEEWLKVLTPEQIHTAFVNFTSLQQS